MVYTIVQRSVGVHVRASERGRLRIVDEVQKKKGLVKLHWHYACEWDEGR